MRIPAKPLVWLHGEVKTPPFSERARREAGFLLRMLQEGTALTMPHSRPLKSVADKAHELRVTDEANIDWRIVYYLDDDAILILDVFQKKTNETPETVKSTCRRRLAAYRQATES